MDILFLCFIILGVNLQNMNANSLFLIIVLVTYNDLDWKIQEIEIEQLPYPFSKFPLSYLAAP